jgi:hypothetical protein
MVILKLKRWRLNMSINYSRAWERFCDIFDTFMWAWLWYSMFTTILFLGSNVTQLDCNQGTNYNVCGMGR